MLLILGVVVLAIVIWYALVKKGVKTFKQGVEDIKAATKDGVKTPQASEQEAEVKAKIQGTESAIKSMRIQVREATDDKEKERLEDLIANAEESLIILEKELEAAKES